jgi:hypothetical protein
MLTTLEKVKHLEQYLGLEHPLGDPVLDRTITKLLLWESTKMEALQTRLSAQIKEFEQHYYLPSAEFYTRYEQGDMGDEMDFMEWASTIEMLANVEKRLGSFHED